MSLPDLNTEDGRAEYRKELRKVALPLRWSGLGLIVLGAIWAVCVRQGLLGLTDATMIFAYAALALGWVLVLAAIWTRTRYHKRRLAQGL